MFELQLTEQADGDLRQLENNPSLKKRLKAVHKALGYLETNSRHPGLNTLHYKGRMVKRYLKRMLKIKHQQHIEYFGAMGQIRSK